MAAALAGNPTILALERPALERFLGILGTMELLERRPDVLPEVLHDVGFVRTQTGRARDIIRNLSRFSSQQIGPRTSVDLFTVVDEVVQLRRRRESLGISRDVEIAMSRTVSTSFTEIEQVILNFVINAQQSIEATTVVAARIRIGVKDAGPHVRLEVVDIGRGVEPANESKLFQPFFTTKPVGHGTGLGLSVSYGIIDSYGGTIGYLRNDWGGTRRSQRRVNSARRTTIASIVRSTTSGGVAKLFAMMTKARRSPSAVRT